MIFEISLFLIKLLSLLLSFLFSFFFFLLTLSINFIHHLSIFENDRSFVFFAEIRLFLHKLISLIYTRKSIFLSNIKCRNIKRINFLRKIKLTMLIDTSIIIDTLIKIMIKASIKTLFTIIFHQWKCKLNRTITNISQCAFTNISKTMSS